MDNTLFTGAEGIAEALTLGRSLAAGTELTGSLLAQVVAVAFFAHDPVIRETGRTLLLHRAPAPLQQRLQGDKRRYHTLEKGDKIIKLAKELSAFGVNPEAFTLATLRVFTLRPQSYGGSTEPALDAALAFPGREEQIFDQLVDAKEVYLNYKKTCPKGLSRLRALRKIRLFRTVDPKDQNVLELNQLPQSIFIDYFAQDPPLAVMTQLAPVLGGLELRGTYSKVSSVAALAPCKRLTQLDLHDTEVADLSPLAGLHLEQLNLDRAPVSSIETLRGMSSLQHLSLRNFRGDLGPLATLPNMVHLSLQGTAVGTLSMVEPMTKLEQIDLRETEAADLSPLAGKALEVVDLDHVKGEVDLRPLLHLTRLYMLAIRNTRFDRAHLEALKEKFPALHLHE